MKTLWSSILMLGVACAGSAAGSALTFNFTGTLTDDPFGLSGFGAPISGGFTFDSAAPDSIAGPSTGSYASVGPGFGFTVDVGGMLYASNGALTVNTANNLVSGDQYGAIASDSLLMLEIFLQDATAAALTSDALPTVPPLLAAFGFRQFRLFSDDAEFLGTVDTWSARRAARSPEPASSGLVLLALALAGLPLRSTRRRCRIR